MRHFTIAAAAAALLLSTASAGIAKEIIKVSSYTPLKSVAVASVYTPWMKKISAEVGDEVEFRTFWGGALGRSPKQQVKLVLDGITDVAFITPSLLSGRFVEAPLFQLPYLLRNSKEMAAVGWDMHEQGMLRGYQGLRPIAFFGSAVSNIHTSKEIKTLEDVKGLKLRASGPGQVTTARLLGAIPIGSIGTPKIATSINRGVVDGVMIGWVAVRTFRIFEVTSHHMLTDLGLVPLGIVMSQRAYDRLSPKAKAAFDKHSGAGLSAISGRAYDTYGEEFVERLKTDPKHTLITLPESEHQRLTKLFQPMHKEWTAKIEDGETRYQALVKSLAAYRKNH